MQQQQERPQVLVEKQIFHLQSVYDLKCDKSEYGSYDATLPEP